MNYKTYITVLAFVVGGTLTSSEANAQRHPVKPVVRSNDSLYSVGLDAIIEAEPDHSVPAEGPKKPLRFVDQPPAFKGDLNSYLAKNLNHLSETDVPGGYARAVVQFVVTEDGLINDIELVRSSGFAKWDEEAVRVMQPMKKEVQWTPGRLQGQTVPVYYTIPITLARK